MGREAPIILAAITKPAPPSRCAPRSAIQRASRHFLKPSSANVPWAVICAERAPGRPCRDGVPRSSAAMRYRTSQRRRSGPRMVCQTTSIKRPPPTKMPTAPAIVALRDQGTLAQLYGNLTGDVTSNAWPTFLAAVQALTGGVTNDDPFGGAAQPAQLAHIPPWTVDLAGKVFAAILNDVVQGKEAHQMNASVRAVLASAPKRASRRVKV